MLIFTNKTGLLDRNFPPAPPMPTDPPRFRCSPAPERNAPRSATGSAVSGRIQPARTVLPSDQIAPNPASRGSRQDHRHLRALIRAIRGNGPSSLQPPCAPPPDPSRSDLIQANPTKSHQIQPPADRTDGRGSQQDHPKVQAMARRPAHPPAGISAPLSSPIRAIRGNGLSSLQSLPAPFPRSIPVRPYPGKSDQIALNPTARDRSPSQVPSPGKTPDLRRLIFCAFSCLFAAHRAACLPADPPLPAKSNQIAPNPTRSNLMKFPTGLQEETERTENPILRPSRFASPWSPFPPVISTTFGPARGLQPRHPRANPAGSNPIKVNQGKSSHSRPPPPYSQYTIRPHWSQVGSAARGSAPLPRAAETTSPETFRWHPPHLSV